MGIILDTSVLIAGERRSEGVQAIIQRVLTIHGEQDAALSVVTLVELTHGIYRAPAPMPTVSDGGPLLKNCAAMWRWFR
jgi:predicted nucleic acid-binding protein